MLRICEGLAFRLGKTKCAVCAAAIEFTHVTFVFKGVRECFAFQNFCAVGKKN